MPAPTNPYRGLPDTSEGRLEAVMGDAPAPPGSRGPGLTAEDLNAVALTHYRRGWQAAHREFMFPHRERLAAVFDEGYDAATVAQLREFADQLRRRLSADALVGLMQLLEGPKRTAYERIKPIREAVNQLTAELHAIANGTRDPEV